MSLYEAFAQYFLIHGLTEVVGSCLYSFMSIRVERNGNQGISMSNIPPAFVLSMSELRASS